MRFIREARACSKINHSNIITVYGAGEEDGMPYMAMEFIDGRELRELIRGDEIDWTRVDERGDRIPDFSFCGFRASEAPIPEAPIRVVVSPVPGDDGVRIQAAIDFVATLEPNEQGLRGAVLLAPGRVTPCPGTFHGSWSPSGP